MTNVNDTISKFFIVEFENNEVPEYEMNPIPDEILAESEIISTITQEVFRNLETN